MWTEEEEEHIGDIRLLNNDGGNVSEGWSDIEIYVREVLEVYQHNSLMRHSHKVAFAYTNLWLHLQAGWHNLWGYR